jgi:hypothetical protein
VNEDTEEAFQRNAKLIKVKKQTLVESLDKFKSLLDISVHSKIDT